MYQPFSLTKNEEKLFLVPKSSGTLLAGLPLNKVVHAYTSSRNDATGFSPFYLFFDAHHAF